MADTRIWHVAGTLGHRHVNADAAASRRTPDGEMTFALADGIGDDPTAARAARVAAATAVLAGGTPREAVLAARDAVRTLAAGDCVLVVAQSTPDGFRIAWAGDTRAYTWDGRTLTQLTADHTVGQYFRDRGVQVAPRLDAVVTSSVRTAGESGAVGQVDHYRPATLLLTTDGIHKRLDAARIAEILGTATNPAAALVRAAENGSDNATAIVVELSTPTVELIAA
ncbi:serine/threonine protein phosphatase [Actinokineospora auranticolor]|uniref:Protein phosphatase n=1 Tax=Actinokineospora auranticolor TaxID=155976 RepID=A0A2S6GMR5_9PSEU|nr:serine/threonine protein phosphatase [Actinokineospora auranticolor]PPK66456.1 protein phosphatase [Actinokineospora auranticolor]